MTQRLSSSGSRYSRVVRSHEARSVPAWRPEFDGTRLRFCDPENLSSCTAWVELRGEPGAGALSVEAELGESVHAGQALYQQADGRFFLASSSVLGSREIVGLADVDETAGETVAAISAGLYTLASWSWTPGKPVYVGLNGFLTQTRPLDGYICALGTAVAADTMVLAIESSIAIESQSAGDYHPLSISASGEIRAEKDAQRIFVQQAEPPDVQGWWVKLDETGAAVDILYNSGS